jgi:ABC-type multidrug transport system fused ATPase/permease subunit
VLHLVVTSGPRDGERFALDGELVIGRSDGDVTIPDGEISRRHAGFRPADPAGVEVRDLGSTNGTWVNERRVQSATLRPGDTIRLGLTTFAVIDDAATGEPGEGFATLAADDAAMVCYRPGTVAERLAPHVAEVAQRAAKRLAVLREAAGGFVPRLYLGEPIPDPAQPDRLVTGGSLIDAGQGHAWMVVTDEAPPEPLERVLALLYGSRLPAGAELSFVVEGFGLHLARLPDPDPWLRSQPAVGIAAAEGELRSAMALSFVRFLMRAGGEKELIRLLTTARPGQVDRVAAEIYGDGLAVLEERWRTIVARGSEPVETRQFLRLTLRYLRPHARREIETFAYMLLALGFTMIFPFAFRRLVDTAIPSGDYSQVAAILAVLGGVLVVSELASLRRTYLTAYVSSAIVRQLRVNMFGRLQRLDAGWFHRHRAGDVLSRLFTDVEVLNNGLSRTIREGTFQALSLLVSAVVLLLLNPILGAIVVVGAPLIGLVYRLMSGGARRRSMAVQEQIGQVTSVANENYAAQPVVKAFGLEEREHHRFSRANERLFAAQLRLSLFGGLFSLSVDLLVTLLRMAILALGAYLIIHGSLTIGGLVAFIGVMGQVITPVTVLTGIGQQVQAATGALIRINEVLEATPAVADAADAAPLAPLHDGIEMRGVSFCYTPERAVLRGVDLTIPVGTKAAIVGPSGAGKSSVLGLLMRLYDPDAGTVAFDGVDLRTTTLASLRRQLGVVFQDTFLFNTTIRENIAVADPGASEERVVEAARAARLDEFVRSLPNGYDTVVGDRGSRLSGGQRQRVAIARALLRDPSVLVLDEATSALDPRTEQLIAQTLDEVAAGRTTIAVTHRLASVMHYHRIFVVDEGRVVEEGTHDELLARGGVYADLWAEQTGQALLTERPPLDIAAALGRLSFFRSLSRDELAHVAKRLVATDLRPGEAVHEGHELKLVQRGRASVLLGADGDTATVARLGPGDAFGVLALLGEERGTLLRADEPVRLLVLDRDALLALMARFPAVQEAMVGLKASESLAGAAALPDASRLAATLSGVHAAPPVVMPAEPEPVAAPGGASMVGDVSSVHRRPDLDDV